jgi:geranylgeranyl diphosphate synthase type II
MGKPIGSDEKNKKSTYLTVLGVEQCNKKITALSSEAMDLIASSCPDSGFLQELIHSLITRTK